MADTSPPSKPMSELVRYEDFKRHIGQGIRNNFYFITITFKNGNIVKKINDKFKTSNTAQDNTTESNAVSDIKVITPFCQEVEIPTFKLEPGEEVFRNFSLPKALTPNRTSKMILWNDAYDKTYDFWQYLISTTNNTARATYADDIMFDLKVEVYDMNSFLYKQYTFTECYAMNIPEKKYSDKPLTLEDLQFTIDFIYRDFKKDIYPSRINNVFSESSVAARLFAAEGTKILNKFISLVADDLSRGKAIAGENALDYGKAFRESFDVLGEDVKLAFEKSKVNTYDNASIEESRIKTMEKDFNNITIV